jgi:hypothetical protein
MSMNVRLCGWLALSLLLACAFGYTVRAQVQFPGTDDFNDNSKDPARWGPDYYFAPVHAQLTETNSRLEYTSVGTDGQQASRPWIQSYPSYQRDWEVQVDVGLGNISLPPNRPEVEFGFGVVHTNQAAGLDYLGIVLGSYRGTDGQVHRAFTTYFATNSVQISAITDRATASQQASLLIRFDAASKTLSTYCDEDGAANGYQWTVLGSVRIDASQSNWQMNSNSQFQLYVSGSSAGMAVNSADQVFVDNFVFRGGWYSRFRPIVRHPNGNTDLALDAYGRVFDLQGCDGMSLSNWFPISRLTNNSGTMTYTDSPPVGSDQRFYRAVLVQP